MALTGFEERAIVVDNLLRRQAQDGHLTAAQVSAAAAACGVSQSTMYRWLAAGAPRRKQRQHHVLTDAESTAFFRARGDVAAAHRALIRSQATPVPSLSTYERAIKREFDASTRAAARHGLLGRDQNRIVLKTPVRRRNERWEGDHTMLEIHVIAPGSTNPIRPWITWLIDVGTRAIMGWGISAGAPNRGTVLAAIRSAVERDGEKPFCGVPNELLWDNGLEFTSNAVTEAAALLGAVARTTAPYSPSQKPFVERLNWTLEVELISKLPHYVGGPRRADGSLEDPPEGILSLRELAHQIDSWVDHYNNDRPHQGIGGRTPAEQWLADPSPIREIASEAARHFTLERFERTVRRDGGIHVDSIAYIAEELYGYEGERVEVGRIPFDATRIEIFTDGRWLCTATPTALVSVEQARKLRDAAKQRDARLMLERRRLAKEKRVRIGTLTSDALDPRLLPPTSTDPVSQKRRDVFGFGEEIGGVR